MHASRPSLSLTEFLIAGLVLGFLGSVITPALRNSSQVAELMRCRSNLHEIGQATYLYASDHDGQIPRAGSAWGSFEMGSYVLDRSFGHLLAERDGGCGLADYIGRPHTLYCPSSRPELFDLLGYKHPDEISATNPMVRMGYMWIYYPPGDRRANASVDDDPHRVLVFDFPPPGTANLQPPFTVTPHPPVLNVLHVGGHVNAVSSEEAINQSNSHVLYDWMTEQSRASHVNPFAGGNPK